MAFDKSHLFLEVGKHDQLVKGDVLLWGERVLANTATGHTTYVGHRSVMGEVLDIDGDTVSLTVLACTAFLSAKEYEAGKPIKTPLHRIRKGQPKREWWNDEEERKRLLQAAAPTSPTQPNSTPKP